MTNWRSRAQVEENEAARRAENSRQQGGGRGRARGGNREAQHSTYGCFADKLVMWVHPFKNIALDSQSFLFCRRTARPHTCCSDRSNAEAGLRSTLARAASAAPATTNATHCGQEGRQGPSGRHRRNDWQARSEGGFRGKGVDQ